MSNLIGQRWGLWTSTTLFCCGLAAACGKTTQPHQQLIVAGQRFDDSAGGAAAGSNDMPREGGAPPQTGGTGWAGEALDPGAGGPTGDAGAPPKTTRPITATVFDLTPEPLEGVKLIIDGQTFVSDTKGVVHAEAPLGAYDVLVDDTEVSEYGSGYNLYQGVTVDELVFALPRDYADQFPPEGNGSGKLTGAFPNDATGLVGFDSTSGDLFAGAATPLNGAYKLHGTWYVGIPATGDLTALLWTLDASQHPNAYWFGSAPLTWDPSKAFEKDIALSTAATHDVSFHVAAPVGADIGAYFRVGPLAILQKAPQDVPLTLPKSLVTSAGPLEPSLVVNLAKTADTATPRATIHTALTDLTSTLLVTLPEFVEPLAPAENATKVRATATFAATEVANSCKVFRISAPGYSAAVHTVRSEVTPPDMSVVGDAWPKGKQGYFSVEVQSPCPSIDWLLSKKTDPAAQQAVYSSGARYFTTAK
jgi:hypothetical protein